MSFARWRAVIHSLPAGQLRRLSYLPGLSARRSAIEGVITPVIALRRARGRDSESKDLRSGGPGGVAEVVDQAVAGGFDLSEAAFEVCGPAVPGVVHFERASGDRRPVELPQQAPLGGGLRLALLHNCRRRRAI